MQSRGSTFAGVLIAAATAFAVAFAITVVWWKGSSATASEAADAGIAPSVADGNGDALILHSPLVAGTTVAIGGVNDPSFAKQLLGPSLAFVPTNGAIISPVDGVVTLVADTGHALGIKTDGGTEVLLHVGIDTVKMGGSPFTVKVAVGDQVTTGQVLLETDLEALRSNNVDPTVILALTNTKADCKEDLLHPGTEITATSPVAKVATASATAIPATATARN
jgi:PTS system sucrose-specific IIC component